MNRPSSAPLSRRTAAPGPFEARSLVHHRTMDFNEAASETRPEGLVSSSTHTGLLCRGSVTPTTQQRSSGAATMSVAEADQLAKSALAADVAGRVVMLRHQREVLRMRQARPYSAQLMRRGVDSASTAAASSEVDDDDPQRLVFRVGFDSRTAILNAARSACLAVDVGPVVAAMPTRRPPPKSPTTTEPVTLQGVGHPATYQPLDIDGQQHAHAFVATDTPVAPVGGWAATALRHKRTELMLSHVPVVGSGMRALLLASEDDVESVQGGVLVVAQVLAAAVAAREAATQVNDAPSIEKASAVSMQRKERPSSATATPWKVVYRGGPSSSEDDIGTASLCGTAARIAGSPHSIERRREAEGGYKDYLRCGKPRPSSALSKRPTSAASRPTSATSNRPPPSTAATAPQPVVQQSDRPQVPDWLDPRGLIGVSVDPRYHQPDQALAARQGFDLFRSGAAAAATCVAAPGSSAGHHQPYTGNSNNASGCSEPSLHYTSFRSETTLSKLRKHLHDTLQPQAHSLSPSEAHHHSMSPFRKGVLRGGAGFLMFANAQLQPTTSTSQH